MTNQELEELLSVIKEIPESDKRDRQTYLILKAAADSISKETLLSLTAQEDENLHKGLKCSEGVVFSEKEIKKMPKTFRQQFRTMGCTGHVRKRKSGENTWNYEIRYRSNGYNISASSNSLQRAKEKFIVKLAEAEKYGGERVNSVPARFDEFANYFVDNFYSRKVGAETLRITKNQFKNHLLPHFGNTKLRAITPKQCQELIDRLNGEEKFKTAEDVFTLMNLVFKAAIKHNILQHNPLDLVFHTKHEREHGSALTKAEEKLLLTAMAGTPQQTMFAVGLYTGMRPNEYATAKIEGDFIVAVNSKRKNGKVEYKKIPITPMLRPYLDGVRELKFSSLRTLRERFSKLFPKHRLYDLRTTFYTRCQECGVLPVARDEFVGHSLGALGNAYTDLSDEFLWKEGQKICYEI